MTMHQTTIRFGTDLWEALAAAAAADGISVAQYVRESAVERLVRSDVDAPAALTDRAAAGRRNAVLQQESSAAVWAQSRLARARAAELRAIARARRGERPQVAAPRA
jgi:hypothetical protein